MEGPEIEAKQRSRPDAERRLGTECAKRSENHDGKAAFCRLQLLYGVELEHAHTAGSCTHSPPSESNANMAKRFRGAARRCAGENLCAPPH